MNNTQKAPYIKPKGKLAVGKKVGTRQDSRRQILDNRHGKSREGRRSWQLTVGKKKAGMTQDVAMTRTRTEKPKRL